MKMKIGTENKKKTIIAFVLLGLAVIFIARWTLMPGGSSEGPKPAPKPPAAISPLAAPESTESTMPKKHQTAHRSDEKMLTAVWKPSLDPSLNLGMLESAEHVEYKGTGRNIFEVTAQPQPVIPKPVAGGLLKGNNIPAPAAVRNMPPPPPPINLKFYGYSTRSGQKTIFLAQGSDSVFVAHEGDIIARRYKIVRINPNSVEVQDLLSNNKQTITLSAS